MMSTWDCWRLSQERKGRSWRPSRKAKESFGCLKNGFAVLSKVLLTTSTAAYTNRQIFNADSTFSHWGVVHVSVSKILVWVFITAFAWFSAAGGSSVSVSVHRSAKPWQSASDSIWTCNKSYSLEPCRTWSIKRECVGRSALRTEEPLRSESYFFITRQPLLLASHHPLYQSLYIKPINHLKPFPHAQQEIILSLTVLRVLSKSFQDV